MKISGRLVIPLVVILTSRVLFAHQEPNKDRDVATDRIKLAGLATALYENDYDDVTPAGNSTAEVVKVLMPYAKYGECFISPTPGGKFHYNVHIAGKPTTAFLAVDTLPIWKEDLADPAADFVVGYLDGHASKLPGADHPKIEKAWLNKPIKQ